MIEIALHYAAKGWKVFPLRPNTKVPATDNGFKAATTLPVIITDWWTRWPDANVGIVTGTDSGIAVLDIDRKHGVDGVVAASELDLPETLTVRTPSGGYHLFFSLPEGVKVPRRIGVKPGLDILGDGGYVVAAGSMIDGATYEIVRDRLMVPVPDVLVKLAARHKGASVTPIAGKVAAGGRNQYLATLAGKLRRMGGDETEILAALMAVNAQRNDPPLPEAEVQSITKSIGRYAPEPESSAAPGHLLPEVTMRAGNLAALVDEAAGVLRASGAPIFQRGTDLFRTARLATDDTGPVRREAGSLLLRFIDSEWLHVELARAATWRRFDAREKKPVPANPPSELARLILARSDDHAWPMLRAIARHPVVTLDGRLITTAGYDSGTGLLLDITGTWTIPEQPTREDAVAACALLSDLLRYFPWSAAADRAVALSMLVTAVMRPVLPTAPMHCVDAPEAGSGKSLLVDTAAILATGRRAAVLEYGRNAEESGKRIDSALLAGDAVLALDNVEAPLEGAALCQTLTATSRAIRVLGQSKNVTVPCSVLLTATGNNLVLRGDIVRRALVCRLDPETDRPELRRFDQDLLGEALTRRPELVAAALTIPLAYLRAGRPGVGLSALGSFEDWSTTVRAALVWAGLADACDTMSRSREVDPTRQTLTALLAAWHGRFGEEGSTAANAVTTAERENDLHDVLAEVCQRHGRLDARTLGTWLRGRRDTRAGSLVLRHRGTRSRAAVWTVEDTGKVSVVSVGGTFLPTPCEFVREESIYGVTDTAGAAGKVHRTLTTLTPDRGPSRTGDIVEVIL